MRYRIVVTVCKLPLYLFQILARITSRGVVLRVINMVGPAPNFMKMAPTIEAMNKTKICCPIHLL